MEKEERKNIKLTLAYEGTSYLGWQASRDGATIEGELTRILEQILQHPIKLQAASRTDAGVHAEGQVANFYTTKHSLDLKRLHLSLNQMLPPSIRIWTLDEVPLSFHPTLEALGKEYMYRLTLAPVQLPFDRYFSWHLHMQIDCEKIEQAIRYFIGKHDFSSFCNASDPGSDNPYCTLYALELIKENEETMHIRVHGNRFLYKMVRTIVGTLVDIGRGNLSLDDAKSLLEKKDRIYAGVTAPACGLCLKTVYYKRLLQ